MGFGIAEANIAAMVLNDITGDGKVQHHTAKIRPDQSIVFIRNWSQVKDRIRGAREILQDIYGLI